MLNIKTVFVTILLPFISLKVLAIEPKTITKNHGLSHLNDKPSEKITIGIKPFFDPKMRKIIINDLNSLGGFDAVEQNVGTKNIRYIVEYLLYWFAYFTFLVGNNINNFTFYNDNFTNCFSFNLKSF